MTETRAGSRFRRGRPAGGLKGQDASRGLAALPRQYRAGTNSGNRSPHLQGANSLRAEAPPSPFGAGPKAPEPVSLHKGRPRGPGPETEDNPTGYSGRALGGGQPGTVDQWRPGPALSP